jgi:hypothetical protein
MDTDKWDHKDDEIVCRYEWSKPNICIQANWAALTPIL